MRCARRRAAASSAGSEKSTLRRRSARHMVAGDPVVGVVGEPKEREDRDDGGRVGQRVAALLARLDAEPLEFVDQPGDGPVSPREDADPVAGRLFAQLAHEARRRGQ